MPIRKDDKCHEIVECRPEQCLHLPAAHTQHADFVGEKIPKIQKEYQKSEVTEILKQCPVDVAETRQHDRDDQEYHRDGKILHQIGKIQEQSTLFCSHLLCTFANRSG
ncbi:hypothetical protein D3C81_2074690 [compost metagenome]